MTLRKLICLPFLLLYGISLFSQEKSLLAIKTEQVPKIDGNLNDAAWANVATATDFVQNYPANGQPASRKTVVKVIYDNSAIYLSAYLYDDPSLVRKQITARDAEQLKDVDYFSVFFDTYNDNQNGFQFVVTSANVPDLHFVRLTRDTVRVVARDGHPLLARPNLSLADYAGQRWVLPARNELVRQRLAQAFRTRGLPEPVAIVEADSPF